MSDTKGAQRETLNLWMQLIYLQLEASCLQWSFLLTVDKFSFCYSQLELFCLQLELFGLQLELFAYSGKARLIRALRDCKQRSLTVSKTAPTVSKEASRFSSWPFVLVGDFNRKRQFVHRIFAHNYCAPQPAPPPSQPAKRWISS